MNNLLRSAGFLFVVLLGSITALSMGGEKPVPLGRADKPSEALDKDALRAIKEGRQTFRYDTFGDEAFWGDALQLHQAIAGEKLGGVGPGVSPKAALAVGLKVDMDALPAGPGPTDCKQKQVDLDDPATTLALLKLNAVVGVKGFLGRRRQARGRSASPAPSATRRWTTPSPPASATGWTAGPTATWTSARSSRWPRT